MRTSKLWPPSSQSCLLHLAVSTFVESPPPICPHLPTLLAAIASVLLCGPSAAALRHSQFCTSSRRRKGHFPTFHKVCLASGRLSILFLSFFLSAFLHSQHIQTYDSPAVLPIRRLFHFLSLFGSRFLSSNQTSRWCAAPNARCYGGEVAACDWRRGL